jgi:hypothetical protein
MANDHPLFIYRYMDRSVPRRDSPRFRVRVSAAFPREDDLRSKVWVRLRAEAGIDVSTTQWGVLWAHFFEKAPIEEVLTSITLTYLVLRGTAVRRSGEYLQAITSALADEQMGFRIDTHGVIHFAVDEVFEGERVAALAGLDNPVLAAARLAYESVFRHLDHHPPDTLAAVRAMFEAVEIVSRQLCPPHRNLHANLCRTELRQRCLAVIGGDVVETRVWEEMFKGMVEWVSALHHYRHGQPEATTPPTNALAVYVVSSGTAYLRLLVEVAVRAGVQPPVD